MQEMATWQKRLSKGEFLKLSKSGQERYIKLYPHSSHRFLMSKGDPDNIEKKPEKPTGVRRFTDDDDVHARRRKHLAVRKDIADFNKSNVAVINPTSLQALDQVKDSHLREASDNIVKNKQEIVSVVRQQVKKLPNMYGKGLGAVRDLVSGEQNPDDMSTTQKHAMHRVLGGVATMALLGSGILVAGMCAAPLGVLAGAVMFNMWAGSKHGKNLRDDIDELRAAREKKRRAERGDSSDDIDADLKDEKAARRKAERDRKNGAENDRDELAKKRKENEKRAKKSKDNGDQLAAASSVFTPNESTEMTDDETIGLIIDHVSDLLKYTSINDFKEQRDEMFAGASAGSVSKPDFDDLRYLLNYAHCHDYAEVGDGVSFACGGGMPSIERLFRRMGYTSSASADGDNVGYHFDNGKGRVTLGKFDENYYIRYDGDFDYRSVL